MSDEENIENGERGGMIRIKSPNRTLSRAGKKDPPGEGCKTPKNEAQRDKPVIEGNQTSMFQGIHPIKFSGNPSDYPTFRNRLRDNLEDGILNDSQKL